MTLVLLTYLLRPVHPTRTQTANNSSTTSPILGHPLYLSPTVTHFLDVSYEVASHGMFWFCFPLALRIPCKGLSFDAGCRFSECVPNPNSSPSFYFHFHGLLLCTLP